MKYQVLQEILLVKGYFERTKDEINYPYPILSINIMYSPARIRTWVVRFLRLGRVSKGGEGALTSRASHA